MATERLSLALERLHPSDWERFEKLASVFLASEFDDLRTVASPSGDEGRDSELFSPTGEPKVLIQYSVASGWEAKVRRTAQRIRTTFPNAIALIYVSNQAIGAAGDPLKRTLRKEGLSLDIRDRGWFVERGLASPAREQAAEELARVIVDPFLESAGVTSAPPSSLSSPDAIAALTLLSLQWQDDQREKGLTKLAFDALVRAVLSPTDSEHRMHRDAVREAVARLLPGHARDQLNVRIDSALRRLGKRAIKHWQKEDEFCLSHEEKTHLGEFKTRSALAEARFVASIEELCGHILAARAVASDVQPLAVRAVQAATDAVLFEKSQAFALAVQTGSLAKFASTEFTDVLLSVASKANLPKRKGADWVEILRQCVREILHSDAPAVQEHMRALADAYTLMAFLRQTPDVQAAVEKMFSHGQIWLDATIVLPLFAELLAEQAPGRFTRMLQAAKAAGIELRVTPGIIEEVERHMNLALTCARIGGGRWVGSVPYLLERYVGSGRSVLTFGSWLETFRGERFPNDDISQFLEEEFGVKCVALTKQSETAPKELRYAVQALWLESHRRRREQKGSVDEMMIGRLVEHDVECYCGVIQLRKQERISPFGYTAWWLTVDRQAFEVASKLRDDLGADAPDSPVLSADFMVNYLAFGPARRRVGKAREAQLPLVMELGTARYLTPELLDEAEKIREELRDMPDRVVRRRVRDHLDRARRRLGPIAFSGVADLREDLLA